jgi:BASS family bile acid:Na+ symporter
LPIPLHWIGVSAVAAVFVVMFSLGLTLGREHLAAALTRRVVLSVVVFAVIVPIPLLAVLVVKLFNPPLPVAIGILLMAISPGAPVAMRRALDAGGDHHFAPALHLAIVLFAVVSVPVSVIVIDKIIGTDFIVSPLDIGRQVFFAQLLPLALGASVRAWRPPLAVRWSHPLARVGNLLILGMGCLALIDLPSILERIGWVPSLAGFGITVVSLAIGAAFGHREAQVWPASAVATAMRNPGLALLIATVNHASPAVITGIIGYAIGLALAMIAFLQWRRRVTAR